MDKSSTNIEFFNKNGYVYYPSFFSFESKKLINILNQIFKLNKNITNEKYGFVDGVTFNENLSVEKYKKNIVTYGKKSNYPQLMDWYDKQN